MAQLVEVTAARAHRSGYAEPREVETGATYRVPDHRVPSLVRQGLIVDPAAAADEVEAGDDAAADDAGDE